MPKAVNRRDEQSPVYPFHNKRHKPSTLNLQKYHPDPGQISINEAEYSKLRYNEALKWSSTPQTILDFLPLIHRVRRAEVPRLDLLLSP